jgi:adenylate kinase
MKASLLSVQLLSSLLLPTGAFVAPSPFRRQNDRRRCVPITVSHRAATGTTSSDYSPSPAVLNERQLDFFMGYLNKHHTDLLRTFAEAYSEIGATAAQRNVFSGGSYKITDAAVTNIHDNELNLEVTIKDRGQPQPIVQQIAISLDAEPIKAKTLQYKTLPTVPTMPHPVDQIVRQLNRLIQLGIQLGGTGVGALKEDLYLNQVPHNRYVRKYFYALAASATLDAVTLCSQHRISPRMKMVHSFPELNPSMDSYRIGTLLELVRVMATTLAEQNLRVRICVQGSMGVGIFTGTPKQLNGVSTILQRMDWESEEGERNEGMVGNYINFGAIGKEHVVNAHVDDKGNKVEQDDVFLLLCPQSMIGVETSIIGRLEEMTIAAGDRPMILINPDLVDKVSSQGQQSVRGRKQRIEFAESFQTIFHFQNIYVSGTSYFPILGAITKLKPTEPWVAHQRRDRVEGGEVYIPVLSSEEMPTGEVILNTFD